MNHPSSKQLKISNLKIKFISLTVLFFLMLLSSTNAQNKITFTNVDDAISLAMKNNSDIVRSKIDQLKANEKVSEVYSENLFPTITLNSRYFRTFKKQVINIFGQTFETGSDNNIINSLDISEPIPVLGTPVFSGIRIAEHFENIQSENLIDVENNVRTNVRKSYYGVMLTKSIVEVNRLTLQNAESNFNTVNLKYKNGVATEFDFLRAKVKVDNILPQLSKSERNYELSQRALSNAIGLKDNEAVDVSGELSYDSTEVLGSTDELIQKISENNVAIRQLQIGNMINKELVNIDKANYLPKLYIFGAYNLSASSNDDRSLFNYPFFNSLNAGLGLSWNLNLFRNSFKVKQSELEVKKTEEQIRDVKQKLKLLSESTLIDLDDAKQRLKSQKETIELAKRGVELANLSYASGVLNQIDVQDAELTLYQSRLAYIQTIYEYQIAKAELEKLLEK
ncbi:MAG: TolC family protein [Ignavibacteria bacterium]|nr:TolC family protein [Ignavibacteria bacterium]